MRLKKIQVLLFIRNISVHQYQIATGSYGITNLKTNYL